MRRPLRRLPPHPLLDLRAKDDVPYGIAAGLHRLLQHIIRRAQHLPHIPWLEHDPVPLQRVTQLLKKARVVVLAIKHRLVYEFRFNDRTTPAMCLVLLQAKHA